MIFRIGVMVLSSMAFAALGAAQETETTINKSLIPLQANALSKFVPPGWEIEKKLTADLNADSLPDFALELIENKPEKDQSGDPTERARALVIVLQNQDGKLARAGVMRDDHQCAVALPAGIAQHFEDDTPILGIEGGRRLVGQQQAGAVDQGSCDRHALLLAAAQVSRKGPALAA